MNSINWSNKDDNIHWRVFIADISDPTMKAWRLQAGIQEIQLQGKKQALILFLENLDGFSSLQSHHQHFFKCWDSVNIRNFLSGSLLISAWGSGPLTTVGGESGILIQVWKN